MSRRAIALLLLVCLALLMQAAPSAGGANSDRPPGTLARQDKGKEKPKKDGTKAKVVEVDVDKRELTVEVAGKKTTHLVPRSVKFVGPRGGPSTAGMKDDRLVVGAEVVLYFEGKDLDTVQLPFRPKKKK